LVEQTEGTQEGLGALRRFTRWYAVEGLDLFLESFR